MGGSRGGGGGSSSTQASIAPELQPLFAQTGDVVKQLQNQAFPGFEQFFEPSPQNIPGATSGQLDILGRQQQRAFGEILTPQEQVAQGIAGQFGQANFPEQSALGLSSGFGQFQFPELLALQQIGQFAGGEIGQSPATQAAIAAAREPVLNDLALAGLGNSGAVGTELSGAFAPILAQELAIRAGVIPQLAGIGQQLRGGNIQAAGLQSQIGSALRGGSQATANFLANQGQTQVGRESQLLGEFGQGEEALRQIQGQQSEAEFLDQIRRQQLGQDFTTGLLGGFPATLGQSSVTKTSGGGSGGVFK